MSHVEVSIGGTVLRFAPVTRLYVHDDGLGPYARMQLVQPTEQEGDGEEHRTAPKPGVWLRFDPREPKGFEAFLSPAFVRQALVPLYPKMRLTAEELLWVGAAFVLLMRHLAGERREQLRTEARFAMGSSYLRESFKLGLAPERLSTLVSGVLVSRYVGVIRFSVEDEWIGDIVCDSTDLRREVPRHASVLAVVLRSAEGAASVAKAFGAAAPDAIVV